MLNIQGRYRPEIRAVSTVGHVSSLADKQSIPWDSISTDQLFHPWPWSLPTAQLQMRFRRHHDFEDEESVAVPHHIFFYSCLFAAECLLFGRP